MIFIGLVLLVFANIMYLLFDPNVTDHVRTWHYFIITVPCFFGLIMVASGVSLFAYRAIL